MGSGAHESGTACPGPAREISIRQPPFGNTRTRTRQSAALRSEVSRRPRRSIVCAAFVRANVNAEGTGSAPVASTTTKKVAGSDSSARSQPADKRSARPIPFRPPRDRRKPSEIQGLGRRAVTKRRLPAVGPINNLLLLGGNAIRWNRAHDRTLYLFEMQHLPAGNHLAHGARNRL